MRMHCFNVSWAAPDMSRTVLQITLSLNKKCIKRLSEDVPIDGQAMSVIFLSNLNVLILWHVT